MKRTGWICAAALVALMIVPLACWSPNDVESEWSLATITCTEQWPQYRSVVDVWKGQAFTSSAPARRRPEHTSTEVFLRKRTVRATLNGAGTACDGPPAVVVAPATAGSHQSNNHGRNPGTGGLTLCWSLYSDGGTFSGNDAAMFQDGGTWETRTPRQQVAADGLGNTGAEKKYRAVQAGKENPNTPQEAGPGLGALMPCDCDPQNAFLGPHWRLLWYTVPFANAGAHWCNNDGVRQYTSFQNASCTVAGLLPNLWRADCLRPYLAGPVGPGGMTCPTLGFQPAIDGTDYFARREERARNFTATGALPEDQQGWPDGAAARQGRINYSSQCESDFMGSEETLESFDELSSDPPLSGVDATEGGGLHDATNDPASCGPL